MSWLARSIVDSLRIDDDDGDEGGGEGGEDGVENVDSENPAPPQSEGRSDEREVAEEDDRIGRGVKEDFEELRESLTRQLLGVASFLAPPPPPPPPPPTLGNQNCRGETDLLDSGYDSSGELFESAGVSENLVHCRDRLGALQPNISTDEADTSYFYFEEDEDQLDDVVGVTEEVLAFAINIAHHPETWLDFPLEEEDDNDDFDLSDAQYKHVLAIQHYAPRLTALRIELCPAHMSEGYFWMVYFVLLNSRLSRQDAEALSTAQLITARTMWMKELQKRTKQETDRFSSSNHRGVGNAMSSWSAYVDHSTDEDENEPHANRLPIIHPLATDQFGTENRRIVDSELQIIDKALIEEEEDLAIGSSFFKLPILHKLDEDEDDDWLNDNPELDGYTRTTVLVGNEEDISFSDLEDNDDCFIPVKSNVKVDIK